MDKIFMGASKTMKVIKILVLESLRQCVICEVSGNESLRQCVICKVSGNMVMCENRFLHTVCYKHDHMIKQIHNLSSLCSSFNITNYSYVASCYYNVLLSGRDKQLGSQDSLNLEIMKIFPEFLFNIYLVSS